MSSEDDTAEEDVVTTEFPFSPSATYVAEGESGVVPRTFGSSHNMTFPRRPGALVMPGSKDDDDDGSYKTRGEKSRSSTYLAAVNSGMYGDTGELNYDDDDLVMASFAASRSF